MIKTKSELGTLAAKITNKNLYENKMLLKLRLQKKV